MLAFAALAQLMASNTVPLVVELVTNRSRPLFGFGAQLAITARDAVISPSPAPFGFPLRTARAVRMSAPLTWSGVHSGCRASMLAAVPATIGAENDVPESWIRSVPTMFPGFSAVIVEPAGIGPTMKRPGAETSGL